MSQQTVDWGRTDYKQAWDQQLELVASRQSDKAPDTLILTITGNNGTGSVDAYLADYRFANNAEDYVGKNVATLATGPKKASDNTAIISLSRSFGKHFVS